MAGRCDGGNPFEVEDVNPFSEQTRGKAGGQSSFGSGSAFYMPDLNKRENELQAREAELNKTEKSGDTGKQAGRHEILL